MKNNIKKRVVPDGELRQAFLFRGRYPHSDRGFSSPPNHRHKHNRRPGRLVTVMALGLLFALALSACRNLLDEEKPTALLRVTYGAASKEGRGGLSGRAAAAGRALRTDAIAYGTFSLDGPLLDDAFIVTGVQLIAGTTVTFSDLEPGTYVFSATAGDSGQVDIPGAVVKGVLVLEAGENTASVTWETTPAGYVFQRLLAADRADGGELFFAVDPEGLQALIDRVVADNDVPHYSLIDSGNLADTIIAGNGSLPASSPSFVQETASLAFSLDSAVSGMTATVTDPASAVTDVVADGATVVSGILPGTDWLLVVSDGTQELSVDPGDLAAGATDLGVLAWTARNEVGGLAASPGDGAILLSWTDPEDTDFTGVQVTYTPGGDTPVTLEPASSPYTVTGLTNGTEYSFTVRAEYASGYLTPGVTASATPEVFPEVAGFTALTGDDTVVLTWTDPSAEGFTGVILTYTPGGTDPVSLEPGGSPYTVTGLTNGTEYTFTIKAEYSSGYVTTGRTASATPAEFPEATDFSAASGDGGVTLTWTDPSGDRFTGTVLTYAPGGSDPVSLEPGSSPYTVTGLTNGTEYTFTLQSVFDSTYTTDGVSATATPATFADPESVSSTVGSGAVRLTWTEPDESRAVFSGVEISYSSGGTPSGVDPVEVDAGTYTTDISGLVPETEYDFTITALYESGDRSPGKHHTAGTVAVPEVSSAASVDGNARVTLSWDDPDTTFDFDYVAVTYTPNGSTPISVSGGTGEYEVTSLTNGTQYTFTLTAYDSSGNASSGSQVTGFASTPPTVSFPAGYYVFGAGEEGVDGLYTDAGEGSIEFPDSSDEYPTMYSNGSYYLYFYYGDGEAWVIHTDYETYFSSGTYYADVSVQGDEVPGIPIAAWQKSRTATDPPPSRVTAAPISGLPTAGETLTINYTSSDADSGDSVSGITFRWLYSATSDGTYAAIPGATASSYTVGTAYAGMYLCAEVTPMDSHGVAGAATTSEPKYIQQPPVAVLHYGYAANNAEETDVNGFFERQSEKFNDYYYYIRVGDSATYYLYYNNYDYAWVIDTDTDATSISDVLYWTGADETTLADTDAWFIGGGETISAIDLARFPIDGTYAQGEWIAVLTSDDAEYYDCLEYSYYSDPDGDAEGVTLYQWYSAADLNGQPGDFLEIAGATDASISATGYEWLRVEITPVDSNGFAGDPVTTEEIYVGDSGGDLIE